ncbi:MAG: TonB-dependent receptor [Bacteroidota bacterium]
MFKVVVFFFLLSGHLLLAQATINGVVTKATGVPLALVNIRTEDGKAYAVTGEDGSFELNDLQNKVYQIVFSTIGFETLTQEIDLSNSAGITLKVVLFPKTEVLKEVQVEGKSKATISAVQPLAVSTIDVSLVQNSTIDAASLLDRANGVRVRQSGGLGSDVNISIQGAQGDAIRRYYDGLPLKYLATGIDINNLPVNQIERIDIYRGITPLEVGTDALGGGINIIPKTFYDDYVDVNYQFGSFNTHRPSVNLFLVGPKEVFFGSNLFLNYSDNNFRINAQNRDVELGRATQIIKAERFHSLFRSQYADFQVGVRYKKWAKLLRLTVIYDALFREVNTPVVFNPVRPVIGVEQEERGLTANLNYKVDLTPTLSLETKTNWGSYTEIARDTTSTIRDWEGNVLSNPDNNGAELLNAPLEVSIDNKVLLQRTTAKLALTERQQLTLSNLFVNRDREGANSLLGPDDFDPFTFPAQLQQNYGGVQWDATWWQSQLETVATYKNYNYKADATSLQDINGVFEQVSLNNNYHGGNVGLKYNFSENTFLRTSFERAYRLPEEIELFGNLVTIGSNVALRPERSNNYNLGFNTKARLLGKPIHFEINGFYRYQKDRIFLLTSGIDLAQYVNENEVEIAGFDSALTMSLFKAFTTNFALTFQDVRIRSARETIEDDSIGERVPNLPYLFSSVDTNYVINTLFDQGDQLQLSYFYDYVESFSSIREAQARENIANFVPDQNIHSLEVTYTTASTKWNLSARLNNIFDDDVFDNFRVQRPGRNLNFKIRYAIQ